MRLTIFLVFVLVFLSFVYCVAGFSVGGKFEVPEQEGGDKSSSGGGETFYERPEKAQDKDEFETLEEEIPCQSFWKCGQWSECAGFLKTRNCFEENKCGKEFEKTEKMICIPGKTSLFFDLTYLSLLMICLIILIIILIIILLREEKKGKKKKK